MHRAGRLSGCCYFPVQIFRLPPNSPSTVYRQYETRRQPKPDEKVLWVRLQAKRQKTVHGCKPALEPLKQQRIEKKTLDCALCLLSRPILSVWPLSIPFCAACGSRTVKSSYLVKCEERQKHNCRNNQTATDTLTKCYGFLSGGLSLNCQYSPLSNPCNLFFSFLSSILVWFLPLDDFLRHRLSNTHTHTPGLPILLVSRIVVV